MKMTSAEANKMLRGLRDELSKIELRQEKEMSFLAAVEEDPETVRPSYDYEAVQASFTEIEIKVRKLKHSIFRFKTEVPGFDMTVDEMLVYIPQLTARVNRLEHMAMMLPKEREYHMNTSIIDYRYANFDIDRASKDYAETRDLLARAQMALDKVNNSVEFEAEI